MATQGTGGASGGKTDARPDISSAELEALLQKNAAAAPVAPGTVQPYDLVAADKIVRGRMPVLDRLNERWIPDFQRDLGELIRQPVEVALQPVLLTPYGEWQAALPAPSSLNLYTVKPWPRSALVSVDGKLLFVLVDSYYGGGKKPPKAARDKLAPTEQRLNRIVVDLAVEHFRRAFAPVAALEFQHAQAEVNPNFLAVATPSEAVVVTRLEVTLGGVGGSLSLVFPLSSFDPVRDKLAEGLKAVSPEIRQRWRTSLRAQLEQSELELKTVFLECEITMRELLKLKPGDILPIEMPKTATLYAGSRPLLRGKFGRSRGYNAVSIVEAVQPAKSLTTEESFR
jgi:flagellar motor switch protein FliM